MGAAQTVMLVGGLLLLVVLSLNFYTSYRAKSDLSINSEALTTATTLCQSMLDVMQTRAFDEKTISSAVYETDSLTLAASFGPEAGENTVTQFDDINDFHNYIQYDTLGIFGIFQTRVTVRYINKLSPNSFSNTRTFSKLAEIFVTNQYLADTVKLKQVIAY